MTTAHQEYVTSGIPWVGDVPAHWATAPLLTVLSETRRKNTGLVEDNVLSLSYGRIVRKDIGDTGGLLPASYETYQVVEADQIIFRFTDLQNDKRSLRSARTTERGIITSAYAAATPVGVEPRYIEYLMRSYDTTKVFYGLGGGVRQTLKFSDIARLPVLVPPWREQHKIADYLDRETARIDTLIEAQQQLVETLRERRQSAVQTHLAELGGKATRLKHQATVQTGVTLSGTGDENLPAWPYLRVANVQAGFVDTREIKHLRLSESAAQPSLLQRGDVLMTEGGDIDKLGRGCYWSGEVEPCLHQNHVFAVRPGADLDPHFLVFLLDGPVARRYFRSTARKTTNLASTNKWTLGNLPLRLPAIELQREAVAYLDEQTARIDTLITEAERFIGLSRERRSALITAAVTGQIDVRDEVA